MKNNKNKLNAIEQFQESMMVAFAKYHSQVMSDNVKRAWQKRKQLSTGSKVAM